MTQADSRLHDVTLRVDGRSHHVSVDPRESLWETLTFQLGVGAANMGCDRMQCGACDVVVDGRVMNSCGLLTARTGGRSIETVGSLSDSDSPDGLHPLQRAFWEEGAFQCGICTRGFLMAAYALLLRRPDPSEPEIEAALAGVICRCGERSRIITAVQRAASELRTGAPERLAPSPLPDTSQVLGRRIPRVQGRGSVTTEGTYASSMTLPGMLFMRTLRSPYPRARVLRVDVSDGRDMPGVVEILHPFNLPDEYRDVAVDGPPRRGLLETQIVHVGMPVAVVAASSEHAADDAIARIEVEYEVQEPIIDFRAAAQAPKQWDNPLEGTVRARLSPVVIGRPDAALRAAAVRVHQVTTTPYQHHIPVELRTAIFDWEGSSLVTYQTTHEPFVVQQRLARWLHLPVEQVRVVQTGFMGSSYGASDHILEELALPAILARITGRPVRSMLSREETFLTSTVRGRTQTEVELAVDDEGKLAAVHVDILFDCGANAGATDAGGTPASRGAWYPFAILYDFANHRYAGTEVFTNNLRAGSMRGVGRNFGLFALETALEKAAYASGRDPLALRLDNLNERGAAFDEATGDFPGRPFKRPGGLRASMLRAAEMIRWDEEWHVPASRETRPGVFHGMAIVGAMDRGGGNKGGTGAGIRYPSTGQVILHVDGHLEVRSGTADVGAGQRTVVAMIAAPTCGIPLDEVEIAPGVDTHFNTDTGPTFASLQTNLAGWGVLAAAEDAQRRLVQVAASVMSEEYGIEVNPSRLEVVDGWVRVAGHPSASVSVRSVMERHGEPIHGTGVHQTTYDTEPVSTGAHAAEVAVDTATGQIDVTRYVAVHDVGKVLNRLALEQQVQGGVVYGLGSALYEELIVDQATGLPVTPNILDYKPPSILDCPPIDVDFVEIPQDYGPYGAIAIGQASTPPVAPVIANAVYNAVGVWMHDLPLSRHRVLARLREADRA